MSVSIQQAAVNAFADYLQSKLPDVVVEPRWPASDKQKPQKSITIVMAGPRRDTPIDPKMVKKTNVGATQTSSTWQLAMSSQPLQLDVWATRDVDRDDIIARLDQLLHVGDSILGGYNPDPFGYGALVKVLDGWEDFGTIADFTFDEPDTDDTGDTPVRAIYRATYTGEAYFMATVTKLTARQVAINFVQRLSETDIPSDFP